MSGHNCMHKQNSIIKFPVSLDLPQNMYHMKNINMYFDSSSTKELSEYGCNNLPNILEQVNKVLKNQSSKVDLLKTRQERVLLQLKVLKDQMLCLKDQLEIKNLHQQVMSNTKLSQNPSWEGVIQEVVIHASPNVPPYSLLVINQLWPKALRVRVSCHIHSSIGALPPNLRAFTDLKNPPSPTLNIRLVWKNMGPDCELVISPLSICKLQGEVNILRYLYRTICSPSCFIRETTMDGVLDLCHSLTHYHTVRDKQQILRALNARLEKSNWLNGGEMTIVDLAAWSALKNTSGVDLNQNLCQWQSRLCDQVILLKEVQA